MECVEMRHYQPSLVALLLENEYLPIVNYKFYSVRERITSFDKTSSCGQTNYPIN